MLTFKNAPIIEVLGNKIDSECRDLCHAMNCLPGVITTDSCCGHGKHEFRIFFKIKNEGNNRGLFFLTRCVDKRYWQYGSEWDIKLSVGDAMNDDILPTCFYLESKVVGADAYVQVTDLYRNMVHHLNHKNFVKLFFGGDVSDFLVKEL